MSEVIPFLFVITVVWGFMDNRRARRSLFAWSSAHNYHLVQYHRAVPWQAPYRYWRGSRTVAWRVTLDDAQGKRHTGLVRSVLLFPGVREPAHIDVTWDDSRK